MGNVVKPLRPRTATRRDHETWDEEMKEVAAKLGYDSMHSKAPMPSMAVCALQYPDLKADSLEAKSSPSLRLDGSS